MTMEERLQHTIGVQAFQIAALQTELEKVQAQLAEAVANLAPPAHAQDNLRHDAN